ncbi:MAG: hypothetical protein M1831_003044 [Alyxoria varia]|nr:MAG: hypothetical protein M1831_003044 [Alyxoria varia]
MYSISQVAFIFCFLDLLFITHNFSVSCEASPAGHDEQIVDYSSRDPEDAQLVRNLVEQDEARNEEQQLERSPIPLKRHRSDDTDIRTFFDGEAVAMIAQSWDQPKAANQEHEETAGDTGHDLSHEGTFRNDSPSWPSGGDALPLRSTSTVNPGPTSAPSSTPEIKGFVENAIWHDRSWGVKALPRYPDQEEVENAVRMLGVGFFQRFQYQQIVRSAEAAFTFGRGGAFTLRFVWLNPHNKVYPDPHDAIPRDWAKNPADYLVYYGSRSRWAKGEFAYPAPVHHGPEIRGYDVAQLPDFAKYLRLRFGRKAYSAPYAYTEFPTLSDFFQMRLNARVAKGPNNGERWPNGMAGGLRSHDGQFAFGWRVYLTESDGVPADNLAKMFSMINEPNDSIIRPMITILYGREVRDRGRT